MRQLLVTMGYPSDSVSSVLSSTSDRNLNSLIGRLEAEGVMGPLSNQSLLGETNSGGDTSQYMDVAGGQESPNTLYSNADNGSDEEEMARALDMSMNVGLNQNSGSTSILSSIEDCVNSGLESSSLRDEDLVHRTDRTNEVELSLKASDNNENDNLTMQAEGIENEVFSAIGDVIGVGVDLMRIFDSKEDRNFALGIQSLIDFSDFFNSVCENSGHATSWPSDITSSGEGPQILAAQICLFLERLQMLAKHPDIKFEKHTKVHDSLSISNIVDKLYLNLTGPGTSARSAVGSLNILLSLICYSGTRVVAFVSLSRQRCSALVSSIMTALRSQDINVPYIEVEKQWVVAALLLLVEIVSSPYSAIKDLPQQCSTNADAGEVCGISGESKEEEEQQESKDSGSDVFNVLERSLSEYLFISDAQCSSLLEFILSFLGKSKSFEDCNILFHFCSSDGDTLHALLLLLSELLNRHSIAQKFVFAGGIEKLLEIRFDPDFTLSGTLLSLIVKKCVRTRSILRLTIKDEINDLFSRGSDCRGSDDTMRLSSYFSKCSSLISQDVSVFVDVTGELLEFKNECTSDSDSASVLVHAFPTQHSNMVGAVIRPEHIIRHIRTIHSINLEEVSINDRGSELTFRCFEPVGKVTEALHLKTCTIRGQVFRLNVSTKRLPSENWVVRKKLGTGNTSNTTFSSLFKTNSCLYDIAVDAAWLLHILCPLIDSITDFSGNVKANKRVKCEDCQSTVSETLTGIIFKASDVLFVMTELLTSFPKNFVFPELFATWSITSPPEASFVENLLRKRSADIPASSHLENSDPGTLVHLLVGACLESPIYSVGLKANDWVLFQMSAVRFIVAMSTFSGLPRLRTVDTVIANLPKATKIQFNAETDAQDRGETESLRLSFFFKLCRLMMLVVTPLSRTESFGAHAAYVEALVLLVRKGTPILLCDVLESISLYHPKIDHALSAGVELLDYLTKPELLQYITDNIDKVITSTTAADCQMQKLNMDSLQGNVAYDDRWYGIEERVEADNSGPFGQTGITGSTPFSGAWGPEGTGSNNEDIDDDGDSLVDENSDDDDQEIYEDQEEDFPIVEDSRIRLDRDSDIPRGSNSHSGNSRTARSHRGGISGVESNEVIMFGSVESSRPSSRQVPRRRQPVSPWHDFGTPHPSENNRNSYNAQEDANDFGSTLVTTLAPSFTTPPDLIRRNGVDFGEHLNLLEFLHGSHNPILSHDLQMDDVGHVSGLNDYVFTERYGTSGDYRNTPLLQHAGSSELEVLLCQRGGVILGNHSSASSTRMNELRLPLLRRQQQSGRVQMAETHPERFNHPLLAPMLSAHDEFVIGDQRGGGPNGLDQYWNGERLELRDGNSILIDHNYGGMSGTRRAPHSSAFGFQVETNSDYFIDDTDHTFFDAMLNNSYRPRTRNGERSFEAEATARTVSSALESSIMNALTGSLSRTTSLLSSEHYVVRFCMSDSSPIPDDITPDIVMSAVNDVSNVQLYRVPNNYEPGETTWRFSCRCLDDTLEVVQIRSVGAHDVCFSRESTDTFDPSISEAREEFTRLSAPVIPVEGTDVSTENHSRHLRRMTLDSGDLADVGTVDSGVGPEASGGDSLGAGIDGSESASGYYSDIASQFEADTEAQHPRALLQRRPIAGTNLSGYVVSSAATVNTAISDMTRELPDTDNNSADYGSMLAAESTLLEEHTNGGISESEINLDVLQTGSTSPHSSTSSQNSSPLSSLSFVSHQESVGSSVISGSALGTTPRGRRMDQSLSITSRVPENEEGIIFDGVDSETVVSALGGISNFESGNISVEEVNDAEESQQYISALGSDDASEETNTAENQLIHLPNRSSGCLGGPNPSEDASPPSRCPPGYDVDVFNSLPEEMQSEILEQAQAESANDDADQLLQDAGYDLETVMALPENIRREIVDQIRRDRREASSVGGAMGAETPGEDNVAFLMSLPEELRAEVLLTSDEAFMGSLTPELVAEATQLRERMAVRFQDRESGFHDGNDDEPEELDEEEDEEYSFTWMGNNESSRRSRPFQNGYVRHNLPHDMNITGVTPPEITGEAPTRPGWFYIGNKIELSPVRLRFVKMLIKLLFVDKLPVRTSTLKKLCFNLSRSSTFRGVFLRVLTGLLCRQFYAPECVEDDLPNYYIVRSGNDLLSSLSLSLEKGPRQVDDVSNREINSGDWIPQTVVRCDLPIEIQDGISSTKTDDRVEILPRSFSTIRQSPSRSIRSTSEMPSTDVPVLKSAEVEAFNKIGKDGLLSMPLPVTVLKRILGLLKFLVRNDESAVFEFLRPRHADLRIATTTAPPSSGSTHTLLESLINCFQETGIEESSICLESVASIVDLLCTIMAEHGSFVNSIDISSPISGMLGHVQKSISDCNVSVLGADHAVLSEIPASPDCNNSVKAEPKVRVEEGLASSDDKWIKVPSVQICEDTLNILCGSLILENCSKRTFEHIANAIEHLSQSTHYRCILTSVLKDVVIDLCGQSRKKLSQFITSRKSLTIDTTSNGDLNASEMYKVDHGQIQIADIGGSEHERLFRTLNILNSLVSQERISEKSDLVNNDLSGISSGFLALPLTSINSVWSALHETLNVLEEDVGGAQCSTEKLPTEEDAISTPAHQAALMKLVPLIKLFFSLHTDKLLKSQNFENKGKSDEIVTTEEKVGDETSVINDLPQPPTLEHIQSIPGDKYRKSPAYLQRNISLSILSSGPISSIEVDSAPSLKNSTSLSRTTSIGRSAVNFSDTSISDGVRLLSFVFSHKKALNELIKRNPKYLETGPLSALVRVIPLRSYLSFHNKTAYFLTELKKARGSHGRRSIQIQVSRENVFENSFQALRNRSIADWRGRLSITFRGEEGIDAGGLTREWYQVLAREIFNPNYALFTAAADGATFQPNPLSNINMNHLDYFKFVGRIIGKAVVDGHLMDAHFTRSFYKHVLGVAVDYTDIEALEPDYYKSLKQILEYPLEDLGLELTFSADVQLFGKHDVIGLPDYI